MSRPVFRPLAAVTAAALSGLALAAPAQAVPLVGLTSGNEIVHFDSATPGLSSTMAITGMAAGERLIGIDLRPTDGRLYGISTAQKIYTLDERTGVASFVAGLDTPVIDPAKGYGFDFNPSADFGGGSSLRLVSSTGSNFAINAGSGVVGNQASNIGSGFSAVAYTNSVVGMAPVSTALYYINSSTDTLHLAPTAFNAPTIQTIGSLGVDVLKANGFEVLGDGRAYAALTLDDATLSTGVFSIDLGTGAATMLGTYDGTLAGLTVSAVPEPGTYGLLAMGLGAIGFAARRRRA